MYIYIVSGTLLYNEALCIEPACRWNWIQIIRNGIAWFYLLFIFFSRNLLDDVPNSHSLYLPSAHNVIFFVQIFCRLRRNFKSQLGYLWREPKDHVIFVQHIWSKSINASDLYAVIKWIMDNLDNWNVIYDVWRSNFPPIPRSTISTPASS